ncbi:MAG: acyloxyacyl hydrolase [Alphaproteobacteria bacterium]
MRYISILAVVLSICLGPMSGGLRAGTALPAPVAEQLQAAAARASRMSHETVFGEAGIRRARAEMSTVVISAIAVHPEATYAIVHEAVRLTPSLAPAVVESASVAYPGYAAQIHGAAEGVPSSFFAQATTLEPDHAAASSRESAPFERPGFFGISELYVGALTHDTGVFGRSEEDSGPDIDLGVRFAALRGEFWDLIAAPRPHLGLHVNTQGDTSQLFAGLTWTFELGYGVFVGADFGLAVHDGELRTSDDSTKELGLRVLFREAAEIGFRITDRNSVSVVLDHISNGGLADENEGLDNFGLRYGYIFGG